MIVTNFSNNETEKDQSDALRTTGHLKVGTYNILGTLGHGNFSVCKLARHTITNHQVAIKCIEKKNLDQASSNRMYREIEIMKSLDHPHIIKLDQVMESKSMIYLVCEYAERGDIFDYISKNGPMNENLACKKFCQILSAVEYCHLRNIVHRDLKVIKPRIKCLQVRTI
jgi:serine/threonine protein kinase